MLKAVVAAAVLVLLAAVVSVDAVDRGKFKKCDDSGFCKRNREYASQSGASPYELVPGTEVSTPTRYTVDVKNVDNNRLFSLEISNYGDGIVRVEALEKGRERALYVPTDALLDSVSRQQYKGDSKLIFGKVEIIASPLTLKFYSGDEVVVVANGHGLFNIEHQQAKPEGEAEEEAQENNGKYRRMSGDGAWEETFSSHKDSKPHGPASIAMDFSFPGSKHLYGIPEHASRFHLKPTIEGDTKHEPYRLYNLDVFEYEIDETMALYGVVPFMISHKASGASSAGVFWLNAAETWVDVAYEDDEAWSHWYSESGKLSFFVVLGPSPKDVAQQYTSLTGTQALPPVFSIAYHQCRWNYNSEEDVADVDSKFDLNDMPYDVIWLDIEHTNGKRYFTWDSKKFGHPEEMQNAIAAKGRRMVTIVDPHIKKDAGYHIHSGAESRGYYVKDKDGSSDYEGFCWPGASHYLDFTEEAVRDWWAEQFAYTNYKGSTEALFIWNDMNEPSVFNGPEVTMFKDLIHAGNIEHRDVHNIFGMYVHMATADGLIKRNPDHNMRPFVLSRAFFAGTQRYGAIWTGDNGAEWEHLEYSVPMLLSISVSGISFCGADVGGFFGNPNEELMIRWYQSGAYQPFFRGHAHHDAKRREPYLFSDMATDAIRSALRARYALLPYWYTQFHISSVEGLPIMRPIFFEYASDAETFGLEKQYLIGSDLMVAPVLKQGQTEVSLYLPGDEKWFDILTYEAYAANGGRYTKIDAPLEKIPVFQRAGSIISRKERPRRSSSQMHSDPITLVVAVDSTGSANGELYIDDGVSFDYTRGQYTRVSFTYRNGVLACSALQDAYDPQVAIERIVFVGLSQNVSGVEVTASPNASVHEGTVVVGEHTVTVRQPNIQVHDEWTVKLLF